jgi:3-mercaptopyruvate sulfurtransferase SseA
MQEEWSKMATNYIKGELSRRGISYEQLREKLKELGIDETANSLNVKINRGTFSFAFALQVMKAIGTKTLRVEEE